MTPARIRGRERRQARRAARDAVSEREDRRALAVNPRMWAHLLEVRATRALVGRLSTRGPTLWFTGLTALATIAAVVGSALRWW